MCQQPFTVIFRRHHCRSCGGLVCDDCSPHRLRLPLHPNWGKVRVCHTCAQDIQQEKTACAEEDHAEYVQVTEHMKELLKQRMEDSEQYKHVLLKLEHVATGDASALERFGQAHDRSVQEFALGTLLARVRGRWDADRKKLEEQIAEADSLQQREVALKEHVKEEEAKAKLLRSEQEELERRQHDRILVRRDIDELEREVMRLQEERDKVNKDMQALEEQKKWAEEVAAQRTRGRICCFRRRQQESLPIGSVQRFTVSTGRVDPSSPFLEPQASRMDQCRHSCALM